MNIILWIVQAVLAIKLLSAAFTHGVRPDPSKMQRGVRLLGKTRRPLLSVVAVAVFLAVLGLILPTAMGVFTWLTPASAALLALMLLAGAGLHLACRDKPNVWVSLVLCALAAFVAYGRWVLAPL